MCACFYLVISTLDSSIFQCFLIVRRYQTAETNFIPFSTVMDILQGPLELMLERMQYLDVLYAWRLHGLCLAVSGDFDIY